MLRLGLTIPCSWIKVGVEVVCFVSQERFVSGYCVFCFWGKVRLTIMCFVSQERGVEVW